MNENNSLVIFTKAALMLAEADTIQKANELKNLALTAADWAKRKGMGEDAIKHCRSYALEAERKMGEMLRETERATGTRTKGGGGRSGGTVTLPPEQSPTLAALGLTKRESSEAQKLAAIPAEQFEQIKQGDISKTKAIILHKRKEKKDQLNKEANLPEAKYRVVLADPPWSYGNTQPDYYKEQKDHYPVMSLDEICNMPIKDLCLENAILFIWVTSPILEESFQVIKAWGFRYKASFVWDKVKHNMGHYNSVRHEFLLVCTRGSCMPDVMKLYDSVITEERTKHSKKPEIVYEIIETLYPHGKKIELFARKSKEGWDGYGNEL